MDNNAKNKKRGFWHKLKLRGRLLTIMLAVALAAVLICAAAFVAITNRILDGAREDSRRLSDNLHFMLEQLVYQSDTYEIGIYVKVQANFIDRSLEEIKNNDETPDWDILVREAYDLINKPDNPEAWGDMEDWEAILFILNDENVYVHGSDKDTFLGMADVSSNKNKTKNTIQKCQIYLKEYRECFVYEKTIFSN